MRNVGGYYTEQEIILPEGLGLHVRGRTEEKMPDGLRRLHIHVLTVPLDSKTKTR